MLFPLFCLAASLQNQYITKYKQKYLLLMKKSLLTFLFVVGLIGSASSAVVTGIGSGDIGYPTYSGQYRNINIQFLIPSLDISQYFNSAELTLNYGFNRGTIQEYSNGRQIKVTLASMQTEQWIINPAPNQEYKFSLNSDILSAITAASGNSFYATVDLILPLVLIVLHKWHLQLLIHLKSN